MWDQSKSFQGIYRSQNENFIIMRAISEIKSSLLSSVECKGSWLVVSSGGNVARPGFFFFFCDGRWVGGKAGVAKHSRAESSRHDNKGAVGVSWQCPDDDGGATMSTLSTMWQGCCILCGTQRLKCYKVTRIQNNGYALCSKSSKCFTVYATLLHGMLPHFAAVFVFILYQKSFD